jgi:TolB protein
MIAFMTGASHGQGGVWVVPSSGGKAVEVAKPRGIPQGPGSPAWSPDQSQIAYPTSDGLFVSGADGSNAHLVATYHGQYACYYLEPTWAPNGKSIAFALRCDGGELGIWSVSPTGGDLHQITGPTGEAPAEHAQWSYPQYSHDGDMIVFQYQSTQKHLIEEVPASGGEVMGLGHGYYPTFSPDGRHILFVHRPGIELMDANGSHVRLVAKVHGYVYGVAWGK